MTQTLVLEQKAYRNEALNWSDIFSWYSQFQDGRELAEDEERGGRRKSNRTEVNIATVADLVKNDRWITSRMIAESLNIPKNAVLRILKDVRPDEFCSRDFFLLHNNAPPLHKAARFYQFWPPKNIRTICHRPYSPDLSSPDYFLFPKLKMRVKRTQLCEYCCDPSRRNWWIKLAAITKEM